MAHDPQQGDVRFSPQTWLIQDDFAAIAAAVQQGWASPAAGLAGGAGACRWDIAAGVGAQRSGAFRHPRGMAGGRGCRKTRAAIDALRKGYLLPQHRLAQRYNRHLWRRRFSDSVHRRALRHRLSDEAVRHGRHGGTTCCGRYQYLRRPADVAVDPAGIDNQLLIMGLQSPRGNGAGAARYASGSASGVSVSPSSARASITFRTLCSWRTFRPRQLAKVNQQRV